MWTFATRSTPCPRQLALQCPHQESLLGPAQSVMLMVIPTLALGVTHALQYDVSCHSRFHNVSQAIYYNYPTYTRQTQLSLSELERENTKYVNLLPLLTELRPDIPVLFEHTGAGCLSVHAKHTWSWVLWSNFLLLVDNIMKSYVAADERSLALVAV